METSIKYGFVVSYNLSIVYISIEPGAMAVTVEIKEKLRILSLITFVIVRDSAVFGTNIPQMKL